MIKLNGNIVTPTRFPDGTGQIWKLDLISQRPDNIIEWIYEDDSELTMVAQLGLLINKHTEMAPTLRIPFLPYSRQDKIVSNKETFGLIPFISLLNGIRGFFNVIETVDVHNPNSIPAWIFNKMPNYRINEVIKISQADIICFPDAGAAKRGYTTEGLPSFNLDKKRNQTTGEIEGLECKLPLALDGKTVLIVDDICDGGRTFIEAAKVLYNLRASKVHLYTTHGLYTKGIDVLKKNGLKRIFNYKGEV